MAQSLDSQLSLLKFYLENLPASLPILSISVYGFTSFELDSEWVADIGKVGAINHELEVWLGHRMEPSKLKERGHGIECLADLFETWTKQYNRDIIITKWVEDVLHAAKDAFSDTSVSVCILRLILSDFKTY
jgi:hypothetical protein